MKFDEIFPKEEFPLRAKTTLEFPENKAHVEISVFYQKPPDPHDDMQSYGRKITFYTENKEICAILEKIAADGNSFIFFLIDGDWVCFLADAEEPEISKTLYTEVNKFFGEEWPWQIDSKLSITKWESF